MGRQPKRKGNIVVDANTDNQVRMIKALDEIGLNQSVSHNPKFQVIRPSNELSQLRRHQFKKLIRQFEKQSIRAMKPEIIKQLILTAINLGFDNDSDSLAWSLPENQSVKPSPVPPTYEVVLEKNGTNSDFLVTVHPLRLATQTLEEGMAGYEVIGRCQNRAAMSQFNDDIMKVVGQAPYSMKHEASGQQMVYRMMSSGIPSFIGSYTSQIEKHRLQSFDIEGLLNLVDGDIPTRDLLSRFAIHSLFNRELEWLHLTELELSHASIEGLLVIAQLRSRSSQNHDEVSNLYRKISDWVEKESDSNPKTNSLTL